MQLSPVGLLAFIVFVVVCLAVLVAVLGGILANRSEEQRACPKCGEVGLKWVTAIAATIKVDGVRAPDSWSLFECRSCEARIKDHRGVWEDPTESDLRHFDAP